MPGILEAHNSFNDYTTRKMPFTKAYMYAATNQNLKMIVCVYVCQSNKIVLYTLLIY